MKKRLLSLCLMAVVTVIGMSAWALQKNTEGAYQIGSAEDLKAFAELVNGGETHAWGQLTADIDYGTEQTMIGCDDYNYCGLFDGQGHTIKFSFYPDADGSALFRNVGTTGQIKNLHVVGNITTSKKYAAGLVVWNSGAISNCVSELTVNSGVAGDATHGGVVAVAAQGTFISNCVSRIVIKGASTECCGGIVGWADGRTNIQNCIAVNNEGDFKITDASAAFGRKGSNLVAFDAAKYVEFRAGTDKDARQQGACYNNFALKQWSKDDANVADGTFVSADDLTGGKVCYMLNNDQREIVWRQTIGKDPCPLPGIFGEGHGQVYASVATGCKGHVEVADGAEAPVVTYSNTPSGVTAAAHTWDNGVCTTCGYFDNDHLAVDHVDGYYMVTSAEDLNWCEIKNQVSDGGRFSMKQMNDIEITPHKGYPVFNLGNWFDGEYNGQGHNLTIDIDFTDLVKTSYAALFPQASGLIENLCLHGTVKTSHNFAGSVVGISQRSTLKLRNIYSDVTVQTTKTGDATCGGIIGKTGGDFAMENVIFAGKVVGVEGTTNCGGICGWAGHRIQMSNVAMVGEIEGIGNDTHSFSRNPQSLKSVNCWCSPTTGAPKQDGAVSYYEGDDLTSGALAYALNGNVNGGGNYYQTVNTDAAPYPFMTGNHQKVYAQPSGGYRCDGKPLGNVEYVNTDPGAPTYPSHKFADGFCTECGDVDPNYITATEDGWYEISTPQQLLWWAYYAAKKNLGAKGRLTDDIDMQGIDNYPIVGREGAPFYGSFDGQFHVISNLVINHPSENGVGFIGFINSVPADAEHKDDDRTQNPVFIRNLTLDESCEVTGYAYVGGILGGTSDWQGLVQVQNCVVQCKVFAMGGANAGGIHEVCMGGSCAIHVDNCGVTSTVRGYKECGVISGWMGSYGKLSNCWSISQVYEEKQEIDKNSAPTVDPCKNFVRKKNCECKNNWWIYEQKDVVNHTFKMDIVPTGELAWVLNGKQFKEPVWYQRVGDDEVPYLDERRGVVAKLGDKYYSIYDEASLTEAVEAVKNDNDYMVNDALANSEVRMQLGEKCTELDNCASYLDLANAMDSINVYVAKVKASQKIYQAYDAKCKEVIAYMDTHDDFEGDVRNALQNYLNEVEEPSEANPIGSYLYVVDAREAADSLVQKETERVGKWLQEAVNTGYMAGSDVTRLITNPTFSNKFNGWQGQVGTSVSGKVTTKDAEPKEVYAGETWSRTLDMHQTLTGLKPGLYLLKLSGAYRPVNDRYSYNHAATFYANDNANYLMTVIEDPVMVNDTIEQVNCNLHGSTTDYAIYSDGVSTNGDNGAELVGYVTRSSYGMAVAASYGRYTNYIAAQVGDDGELTIGIKSPSFDYGQDWVGYSDLRLKYLGDADDDSSSDVDLALQSQLARLNTILEKYVPSDGVIQNVHYAPAYPAALQAELTQAKAQAEAAGTVEEKMQSISQLSSLFQKLYEAKMAYIYYYGMAYFTETLAGMLEPNISMEEYSKMLEMSDKMIERYQTGSLTVEEALHPAELLQEPLFSLVPKTDEDGTFHLSAPKHLMAFSAAVSAGMHNINAVLDNDIDMAGFRYAPAGAANESVNPDDYVRYTGTFDGKQHTISNLTIGSAEQPYSAEGAALLAKMQNATVKDLQLQAVITSSKKYIAGIASHTSGKSKLQNCSVNAVMNSTLSGDATNGGLVAVNDDEGTSITDCYVHAVMLGENAGKCGGIVGWASGKVTVRNCLAINEIPAEGGIQTDGCNSISRNPDNCTAENTYYTLAMGDTDKGTKTTFKALSSGEVTWKLNGSKGDGAWYQTLGTDTIPHLYSGDKVWYSGGEYVNEEPIVELNAFAFNVRGNTTADDVKVHYTLNAPARAVDVVFYNGDTQVASIASEGLDKGAHTVTVPNSQLAANGTTLRFEVKVTGFGSKDLAKVGESYSVWNPFGLACNNVPSSAGFGQTYLIETQPQVGVGYDNGKKTGYISDTNHSALYAFDADFQQIMNKDGQPGFKGGLDTKFGLFAHESGQYDLKTVRVSRDGRVFVGRGNGLTNSPIVEVNPADLNADFTPLFTAGKLDENTGIVYTGDGAEQARMVSSFDVEGEGANLKLWVLGNQHSDGAFNYSDYACHTYNLGTASAWAGAASSVFEPLTGRYTIAPKYVNVMSDQRGGLWYVQYRDTPTEQQPSLKHYNAEGKEDFSDITTSLKGGAMAMSPDGETFALPLKNHKVIIYTTDYAPNPLGKIFLNQVGTFTIEEDYATAMAFDYAGNLYVASESTETVTRYTVPRANKVVVTPAAATIQVGDATGIDAVESEGNADAAIYNVAGQRLPKTQKGVNIVNGKKVMVK